MKGIQLIMFVLYNQVFVMLSDYIRKGEAYIDENKRKLSLYHTDQPLSLDYVGNQLRKITILTLSYCQLQTLKGIEQFQQLEELNIKFNNITEIAQLYRIRNKEAITKLQFNGNQIEYLGGGLFINLVKFFPNLIEMNGRNYLDIIHHHGGKNHSMKKILNHSKKLQKQMIKTIRREMARNQVTRQNYASEVVGQAQTKKYILEQETNEEQLFESRSKFKHTNTPISQNRRTSKKKYQPSQHEEQNYQECGLKENRNFNNVSHNDRDVSLGAISNIPMTKSVRASVMNNSQIKLPQKNKGLQIFVLNQSIHSQTNHNHYAQPTATFAMQRQKQNLGFDFREKKVPKKYQNYAIPIEEYNGESKFQLRPTKRQTNGSFDQEQESMNFDDSSLQNNLITNPILLNERETMKMARHYYQKHVEYKVFMALKYLPKKKNLPMRLNFQ